jgi:hypothetical protein
MVGSVVVWMWTVGVGCFFTKINKKRWTYVQKNKIVKYKRTWTLKKLEKKLEKKYLSIYSLGFVVGCTRKLSWGRGPG